MNEDLELVFCTKFSIGPRLVPVRQSNSFHSHRDPCYVSPFVCLEPDINRPTWQKLLLERVVFGACCGVGSSMFGDVNQQAVERLFTRSTWPGMFGPDSRP